ncbi:hypothetical protein GCM10020229_81240 [Kitasatospora albolonga]|uniref:DUF7677 family protein n=1 Tax=Kitasatospora albolonga TaxID=68173 RepID=UPI003386C323
MPRWDIYLSICVHSPSVLRVLPGQRHCRRDLLDGFDYRPALFRFGSHVEQVFAVYSNVLEIDSDGNVLNDGDAQIPRSAVDSRLLRPDVPGGAAVQGLETELTRAMSDRTRTIQ